MSSGEDFDVIMNVLDKYHVSEEDARKVCESVLSVSRSAHNRGVERWKRENKTPEKKAMDRLIAHTQEGYLPKLFCIRCGRSVSHNRSSHLVIHEIDTGYLLCLRCEKFIAEDDFKQKFWNGDLKDEYEG